MPVSLSGAKIPFDADPILARGSNQRLNFGKKEIKFGWRVKKLTRELRRIFV